MGGNVNTLSNTFEGKYFHPVNKRRNVIGVRVLAAVVSGFGGIVLPPFNRFYLGGEDSIRGFDYFSISPWAFVPTSKNVPIFFLDPQILDAQGNPTCWRSICPRLRSG